MGIFHAKEVKFSFALYFSLMNYFSSTVTRNTGTLKRGFDCVHSGMHSSEVVVVNAALIRKRETLSQRTLLFHANSLSEGGQLGCSVQGRPGQIASEQT